MDVEATPIVAAVGVPVWVDPIHQPGADVLVQFFRSFSTRTGFRD